MPTVETVIEELTALADPSKLEGMAHFALVGEKRLGIPVPELRRLAKQFGRDHALALALWQSGYSEARILASMIDIPGQVTETQLEQWVADFDAWDICDQVCMNLFEKVPAAIAHIPQWVNREEEFVRRTPFSLIACLAWHDKQASDASFIAYFPLLSQAATDERNFVKKAVNWALRNIGKRNPHLNQAAIQFAQKLQKMDSKSARWIAADALRELTSDAVQRRVCEKHLKNTIKKFSQLMNCLTVTDHT